MTRPDHAPHDGSLRSWNRRYAVALVALVVLAYAGALPAPFLFDDAGAVVNNPTIRRLGSLDVLRPPSDGSTTTARPLVNLSYALNYALSGDRVWSYHALNLALHAAAALALFGIVRRTRARCTASGASTAGLTGRGMPASLRNAPSVVPGWTAFGAATLWALHPLQTESVVCIAQRTEVLCGTLYLATLYAFIRGVDAAEAGAEAAARRWYTLSVGACLLGMASKEVMVTAPLVVLLYDRVFLAGRFTAALKQRSVYYAALAGTWLLLAGLIAGTGGGRGASAGFGLGVTAWNYLLTQADALVRYVRLAGWPHPLVLDYGNDVVRSLADVWWQGSLVLVALGATAWALVRRPVVGFAGAWFFAILAPSSSLVPLVTQTVAEHRMYLPLAAVVVLFAETLHSAMRAPVARFAVLSVALALGVVTFARVRVYRDPLRVWAADVANFPSSARAHNNLALLLQERGQPGEANVHFGRATALQPNYVWAHFNWGVALLEQGQFEAAALHVDTAARLAPGFERQPRFAEAQFQLGRLAERAGRPADAEMRYETTLRLSPEHAGAHARLGLLLARAQRLEPAAEHFRAAVRLQPTDADAHANLGNVLLLLSRPREALVSFEAALRLRPDDPRLRQSIEIAREAQR